MVNSLTNISPLKNTISCIFSSKQRQIFVVGSIVFLISLPFLRPLAKQIGQYIWSDKSPKTPNSSTSQTTLQFAQSSSAFRSKIPITGSSEPFTPYQLTLKVLRGTTFKIDIENPNENLLNFTSRALSKATSNKDSLENISYYDDARIIIAGKVWNTTELEYISMHELCQEYKFLYLATIYFHINPMEDAEVKALANQLLVYKDEISKIFNGLDFTTQPREILQQFRAVLHSYCDRIFRGKLDTASSGDLQSLQETLIRIVESAPDSKVRKYFNGLLASVSNVYAQFQDSFKALWEGIENRIHLMPEPEKPTATPNSISIGNQTFHFSLEDNAKHAIFFDSMKEFGPILQEGSSSWNFNHKPDEVQDIDLSDAMQYLSGNDIKQTVKDRPLLLSRAAIYLGIPRLVLMCEVELIKGVEKDHLKQDHFKQISLERIRIEMPHLYKAFDMKGWLKEDTSSLAE